MANPQKNFTPADGKRLRCIKGARAAHRIIRLSGRFPGEEARAARKANAARRREEKRVGTIATLSQGTENERDKANQMILEHAAAQGRERVEHLAREWQEKMRRLNAPKSESRVGYANVDGLYDVDELL